MNGDPVITRAGGRQLSEQQRAAQQFRALAKPYRFRVQADAEGFGSCSNEGECEAVCPKDIPISNIARMTREYVKALWTS